MAATKTGNITVNCPCCNAKLIINTNLGKVVLHEQAPPQPQHGDLDLGNAQNLLMEQARRREEIFAQSTRDLKIQSELLDQKFAEALEKSKESPITRPTRDIDLD